MPSNSTASMNGHAPIGTRTAVHHAASRYLAAGLAAIPAVRKGAHKKACVAWTQFQTRLSSESEWHSWADLQSSAIAIVAGAVSGNLEVIDFDMAGEKFEAWRAAVEAESPGLIDRLVLQRTPSAGWHVVYRCEAAVPKALKLAQRRIDTDGPDTTVIGGKPCKPRQDTAGRWHVVVTLIETRGEASIFLCAPSDGYEVTHGDLAAPLVISESERNLLIGHASDLDEHAPPVIEGRTKRMDGGMGCRPRDDFAARGNLPELLARHGWTQVTHGANSRWRRPGKAEGWSATLRGGCFYVFTSNAPPFEPMQGYGGFAVFAMLEHRGDFSKAASALAREGYGATPSRRLERERAQAEETAKPDGLEPTRVEIDTDEFRVVNESIEALSRHPDVYARGNMLVRVQAPSKGGRPAIVKIPSPTLRECLSRSVRFVKFTRNGEADAHPPKWAVEAVAARGTWRGVRELTHLALTPYLLADGSVCQVPGYYAESGVLLVPSGSFPPVPADPTRDDAVRAVAELLEVVSDFVFELPEHRSAWLAVVLTVVARRAFSGPAPLFLIDANVRGAGKGLLGKVACAIVTGEEIGNETYVHDTQEMRKRITAIAIAGQPVVLLDNLSGPFGNAAIDAALTTTRWQDRILGTNDQVDLPLESVWLATGNNVQVAADTARRIVHMRLDVLHERPEERGGFAHPDLLGWAIGQRARLLVAALTIMSAYVKAEAPAVGLTPLGSFIGWSNLVRNALVWTGQPDPCAARHRLEALADTDKEQVEGMLCAFEAWDPHGHGVVLSEMVSALYPRTGERPDDDRSRLVRSTIEDLVGNPPGAVPSVRKLGNRLKGFRRRVSRDRFLDFNPDEKERAGQVWRLHRADKPQP